MRAWNGDVEFKAKFMGILAMHREQDRVIAGTYGEMAPEVKWQGCAIACGLRSLAIMDGLPVVDRPWSDHSALALRLSIPLVLARLEDRLFEGMSEGRRPYWPERFADAIAPGADLSGVWGRLALWLLRDQDWGVLRLANSNQSKSAIEGVAKLYERRVAGDEPTAEEWRKARSDAADAGDAYDDYTYAYGDYAAAAAATADSPDADYAAYDAAAAYAAAAADYADSPDAAATAADSRRRYHDAMSDRLIQLMQECKS